ncbi:MAG: hypothetical protein WBM65_10450 [Sedimenticolaceae bacterium]
MLFVVDVGGPYGYGHFMRCRELAGQIVERLSWPAAFLLDDERAADMAKACGFKVYWGSLGRAPAEGSGDRATMAIDGVSSEFDLVVIDISARRGLDGGWRNRWFSPQSVVVMDREDAMASEADLIIYPGVTGRANNSREGFPPILEGLDYVILRREVRRYQRLGLTKDIDLLAYLHDKKRRNLAAEAAQRNGWRLEMPVQLTDKFPELLARSRVFLSGYGQSFYEAMSLSAYPVAWPISESHRRDAAAFYRAIGTSDSCLRSANEVSKLNLDLLSDTWLPSIPDGTAGIVFTMSQVVR